MRDYVIAGNWKMHKDYRSAEELVRGIRSELQASGSSSRVRIVLCPPFPLLDVTGKIIAGSGIYLGAQNLHPDSEGAFTGEVSASMLKSVGCEYVIVGHSERRRYFGETDAIINAKALRALNAGLHPIICIGETLEQREEGVTNAVIDAQVRGVLANLGAEQMGEVVIAYEPVWAIGTGRTATPAQAQEAHAFIRGLVSELYSPAVSEALVIQYGGSLKPENARDLLSQRDIDGGLIGGASLTPDQFCAIVRAALEIVLAP
jgi:triosephosphate isomerase (TIM)